MSEYKIPEQVLQENLNPKLETLEGAVNAMKEYGRLQAIRFKEWQDENLEEKKWENYDGHDEWYNPVTRHVISTSELYDIFLEQTKK